MSLLSLMPTSVTTASEFNDQVLRINVNEEAISKLDARIKKLEDAAIPSPTPTPNPNLYDDFKYTETFQVGKPSNNGKWLLQYTSSGSAKADGNGSVLVPGGTELSIYSGSVLLRSTKKYTNSRVTFYLTNEKQVYTKDKNGNTITPPGWHAPWPFIRHVDKYQHWYAIIGRDKVEMGKKDAPRTITDQATIEHYQFTIWTGGPPTPVGMKRKVTMECIGNKFSLYLDDVLIKTLVDDGNLIGNSSFYSNMKLKQSDWTTGEFCEYVEGCQGRFEMVSIETL